MVENRMREWLTWKVFGPFIFFLLIWPIYYVFHDPSKPTSLSHTFHHAFAHCELLIFSSLVFIEMAMEISYLKKEVREKFQGWLDVARLLALIPIFLYGVIVADVIRNGDGGSENYHANLMLYSWLALSISVLAVSTSVYTFWKVKHLELAARARRAKEPKRRHL